jgi:hypothetical protein
MNILWIQEHHGCGLRIDAVPHVLVTMGGQYKLPMMERHLISQDLVIVLGAVFHLYSLLETVISCLPYVVRLILILHLPVARLTLHVDAARLCLTNSLNPLIVKKQWVFRS